MNPREDLLEIQKVITSNIKEDIEALEGRQSPTIKRYTRTYAREFKKIRDIIDKNRLISRIARSDIVYIGDYHTLDQSQKTVIKILREIVNKRQNITIAMEMINHEKQRYIDDFMAGKIQEEEFLRAIDYYPSWGFPWRNYKPIFDFAKINKVRIKGINCNAKSDSEVLHERDSYAAKLILDEIKANPKNLVFVLYGDLHIAEKHIPKITSKLLIENGLKKKHMIVFQNSEELYWRLADQGKEHITDVVEITSKKFCIMNTPPWIKLQTYLNWLEHGGELLLSPKDSRDDEEPVDYFHQINNLMSAISSFLELKTGDLTQFHIYTSEEVEFVDFMNNYMKSRDNLSLKEVDLIRGEIIFDGICLIPEQKVIYLSNLSLNKVSEKVAQFLSYTISGHHPRHTRDADRDFFYSRVLLESLGFFGSKIINFKRKSDRLKDFENFLEKTKGQRLIGRLKDQRTISSLVVEHKMLEERLLKKGTLTAPNVKKAIYHEPPRIFLGITKALGYIVGNRLFIAIMRGKIERNYIKNLFAFKPQKEGDSFRKYMEIVSIIKDIKERFRTKSGRFLTESYISEYFRTGTNPPISSFL